MVPALLLVAVDGGSPLYRYCKWYWIDSAGCIYVLESIEQLKKRKPGLWEGARYVWEAWEELEWEKGIEENDVIIF